MCEIRRSGEAIVDRHNGDIFCYKGQTKGQRGVGFIIKKEIIHMVQEIRGISERIMVLTLQTNKRYRTTIIQIYAPTENSNDEDIEDFYNELECTIEKYRSNRTFIIGDFNSKVGNRRHTHEDPVGPYIYGNRNVRGERLVQFVIEQNMKIVNTFFRKKLGSKWTWRHPNGTNKNEIDYVLSDSLTGIKNI